MGVKIVMAQQAVVGIQKIADALEDGF